MALISAEKISGIQYEIKLNIDGETFGAAINKVYNREKGKIQVPGFRKGKAPKHFIEQYYGENVFYEDALDEVFPEAYKDAVKDIKETIVSSPFDFDIDSISKEGVELSFKVEVKPEIELKEYKGLTAEKAEVEVTEENIEHELEHMRQHHARIIDIDDRAAAIGDTANIDFEGFVDGVAFDGGKGEGYDLELGSGSFIPGFEEQVVGHNVGEEFDIDVTFPAEYKEDLANKDAVFKIKLNSIKFTELPELDDEFAKDVSEDADTLDELKKSIAEEIKTRKSESADRSFRNDIITKLADCVEAEIPNGMIESAVEEQIANFKSSLAQQGLSVEMYMQYTGMDLESMKASMRPSAETSVKVDLALEKIAELENITVSDEEIDAELSKAAEMYGMELEKIKEIIPAEYVKIDLLNRKATDFVVENAVAEAPTVSEE
jgi:trigger factor